MGLKKRFIFWLLLVAIGTAHLVCWAASDAEIRESIETVLAQRHPTDTPEWWKALGAHAPKIMMDLYEESSHIYRRSRLITALGYFDSPEVGEFLKKQALNTPDDVIRNGSIRALGNSQGSKERDFVSRFLDHNDGQTRAVAAQALNRMGIAGDARAAALFSKFLNGEKTAWVRDRAKELPKAAVAPIRLVTTPQERRSLLSADFAGSWSGVVILPGREAPRVESAPITIKLRFEGPSADLVGDVYLPKTKKRAAISLKLEKADGKEERFKASLAGEGIKLIYPKATTGELALEAELLRQEGVLMIRANLPAALGTIVLRR